MRCQAPRRMLRHGSAARLWVAPARRIQEVDWGEADEPMKEEQPDENMQKEEQPDEKMLKEEQPDEEMLKEEQPDEEEEKHLGEQFLEAVRARDHGLIRAIFNKAAAPGAQCLS